MKHTPAEWQALRMGRLSTTSCPTIATCDLTSTGRPQQRPVSEQIANARLIATAPDLLAVLKAIVAATSNCGYDCRQGDIMDAVKLAKSVIAKAEGTEHEPGSQPHDASPVV